MNTALLKKLRLNVDEPALLINAPEEFGELMKKALKTNLHSEPSGHYAYVQAFCYSCEDVAKFAPIAVSSCGHDSLLWMCYPKKSSKIKTDITRDMGWSDLEKLGYIGIALVSIDETWSAMRFRKAEFTNTQRRTASPPKVNTSTGSKIVEIPVDLQEKFEEYPECKTFFNSLAYTHRKEYVHWISEAKRQETRVRRINGTIERLQKGIKNPSIKV
ncbi:YdeI/OmpD-associated family protein [Bacillus sp. EAC]|uniref:YdeI/OmpD-associated family protein n=1 Tax=Bacillus sp. EAC TaxID=1978338 RepID=UPI000B44DD1A|nr:YdeI/OmpD-associated family protein [Bacillus sp. EAC]